MLQFTFRPDRAVLGMIAVGIVVAISGFNIVRAEHISPDRIFNCSSGTACVEGNSTGSTTWGVYGISASADGVHGVTSSTNGNSAVAGIATGASGKGNGVYGKSANGEGVFGVSSYKYGVEGHYSGGSPSGAGIYGYAGGAYGVVAESASNGYPAVLATGDKSNTWLFQAFNSFNDTVCNIDPNANLTCDGTIMGGTALRTRHRNSNGEHVLTYASESASETIEDVGTARMIGGVANVQIDPAFAAVIDHKWYYVFLTPLGDTRGLYVSMKTATAFQVRETEHGRSALEFDYRIVAHPLDAKNDRLPLAPAIHMPRSVQASQQ